MPRLPDSVAVLRERNFRLMLAGHGVSVFGDRMVALALAFAVLEVGGSVSDVGLVLASGALALVASVLAGGVVADRVPRRTVMVAADIVRLASQGAAAALLIGGVAEVWSLAVLSAATGLGSGFFNPAATGLLPEIVPAERLQPANALRASAVSVGEIGGPIAAGILVATAGAGPAIAVDAATFAVSAACLSFLRVPRRPAREPTSFVADLREGWGAFVARRWVWTYVVYFSAVNLLWATWLALGPVVADRHLGGAAPWGAAMAAVGIGTLMGSVLATRARPRRPLMFIALTDLLFALPLALLAARAPVAALAAVGALSGMALTLGMSVWETTLQRHIPGESLSRVASYDWFGSFAFYPLGLAIWGPIASVIGLAAALWIAFSLLALASLTLFALPDTRRLGPYPARPAAEVAG